MIFGQVVVGLGGRCGGPRDGPLCFVLVGRLSTRANSHITMLGRCSHELSSFKAGGWPYCDVCKNDTSLLKPFEMGRRAAQRPCRWLTRWVRYGRMFYNWVKAYRTCGK